MEFGVFCYQMVFVPVITLVLLGFYDANCDNFLARTRRAAEGSANEGYCANNPNPVLGEGQVPGECNTFHGSPCLCNLNPNCVFDAKTEMCTTTSDCSKYHGNAPLCRKHYCYFDCSTSQCTRDQKSMDPSCEEAQASCGKYCFDPCYCKLKECEYFSNGQCRPSEERICPDSMFYDSQCGRVNAYYHHKGLICKNLKHRGNCAIEKTILGSNMNGTEFTDTRGTTWIDDRSYINPQIAEYMYLGNMIMTDNEDDRKLYQSMLTAIPWESHQGLCVTYYMEICDDGHYELVIKTAVLEDYLPGEKFFNIKLNDTTVFMEVDIMKLAKAPLIPVELILNFKIKNRFILIDGYDPIRIEDDTVPLSFCYSCCGLAEGTFEIAAVSVSKFTGGTVSPTPHECMQFTGRCYACKIAGCDWIEEEGVCQGPKPGTGNECGGPACVEILFMLDSGYHPDEGLGKISKSYPDFNALIGAGLLEAIRKKYACSRFGLATNDDVFYDNQGPNQHHQVQQSCFQPRQNLTDDIDLFKINTDTSKFESLKCYASGIPLWFSGMLAVTRPTIGFTPGSKKSLKKYLLYVVHRHNDCKDRSPKPTVDATEEGPNDCISTKQPPHSFTRDLFEKEGIQFIMVTHKHLKTNTFEQELRDTFGVSRIVININDQNPASNVVTSILDYIAERNVRPPQNPNPGSCPTP